MAAQEIKVMIVEDDVVTRKGLQLFLEKLNGIRIIEALDSGETAATKARELKPDIVLMDVGLPGISGIAAARQIKSELPAMPVLMVTASDDEDEIFDSFGAGADGYVLKSSFSVTLESAIRSVQCGSIWLDPHIAQRLLKKAIDSAPSMGRLASMSKNEKRILQGVANASLSTGNFLVRPEFMDSIRRYRAPSE